MFRISDKATFDGLGREDRGRKVGHKDTWVVRGPQGEFYGRYPYRPHPSQIPLYSTVEHEKPGWKVGFGESDADEDQGLF